MSDWNLLSQKLDKCKQITHMDIQTSSKLNSTPPIGAPNATPTPAADAADRIWNKNTEIITQNPLF